MTTPSKGLNDIFNAYKHWIVRNPSKIRNWESVIYFITEFLLGKFNGSLLKSEWLRSVHRLISLFNGLILLHSKKKNGFDGSESLNIFIAALEHCEIAIEKSAEKLWGNSGKYTVLQCLQILKFLAKATLVVHFKAKTISHPCAGLAINKTIQSNVHSHDYVDNEPGSNNVLKLKSSGRIMRTVASAPPLCNRLWKPPVMYPEDSFLQKMGEDEEKIVQAVGQLLYLVTPIISLALIRKYGSSSWKPWTSSLFMDLLSSYLQYLSRRLSKTRLTPNEMSKLAPQRYLAYYFIRSPFFQSMIATPLYMIVHMIPVLGPHLSEELQFYLSSYLFLWSK